MPNMDLPKYMKRVLKTSASIVVLFGGRGSAKSESLGRTTIMKIQTEKADFLCGREFQNSIDDSVHKLLDRIIHKTEAKGFTVTDKKIQCSTGGGARFRGFNRNPEAVKSAQEFKYSWIEQAETLSQESIDDLLPTILRNPGSKVFMTANPMSSADPFSKEFIVPFLSEINLKGYYEDDMYLVMRVNWRDNPWHKELEPLRMEHYRTMTRAKYDWIWEGEFNDSVEDPLIMAEWFDACIDAHKKLGFVPRGIRFSSYDPADGGDDNHAYAFRTGNVLLDLQEKDQGQIDEGCDWATGNAIRNNSNAFTWDCDGMGAGLKDQVGRAFDGSMVNIETFKGSRGVELPDAVFEPTEHPINGTITNKDALKNQRAQYYYKLRKAIYKTYQAINGVYHNPDDLFSIDSSINIIQSLRSELCRMPIKPNPRGLFELYTKEEMKKKFKFKSPNLADAVMMLQRPPKQRNVADIVMPQPIGIMGQKARTSGHVSAFNIPKSMNLRW